MAHEFAAAGATLHIVPMRRVTTSGSGWRWLAYLAGWPVSVVRLIWLGRSVRADVIHSNSLHSWYGWAVAAVLRRPHVWHAREVVVQSTAALRLERWLCRRFAARVIAVSGAVGAQLDPANLVILYDEADPAEFYPTRAGRFRSRVDILDCVPLVGAVGRIDTGKGVDILLAAVPAMQAARPGLEVVIAGGVVPDKEAYAERLAQRSAEMTGVHWLGQRADVADLIADLDVLVFPSTKPESFGLVLVEALASGVPVVATAAGGPLEILRSCGDGTARLIPPGDAVALAEATTALIPPSPLTSDRRRARPVLRRGQPVSYSELFDAVLGGRPR
jgi:glycosyltransferase involved in cell wall biosynthesis